MKKVLIILSLVLLFLVSCSKHIENSEIKPLEKDETQHDISSSVKGGDFDTLPVEVLPTPHTHSDFDGNNVIEHDVFGYCGNTITKIRGNDGFEAEFWGGHSVNVSDLLRFLEYKENSCDCISEYIIDTEFELGYGVSLTGKFARHDGMQASLTDEQVETIESAIEYARTIE